MTTANRCVPAVLFLRALVPALLAALVAGCALFAPRFVTPRLSVVDVQLQHADLIEQQLKVRLRVQNPNDRRLPVKGLAYTLEIEGQELAHGVSGASFVVPANGEAEFDTNVTANLAGVMMKLLRRGSAPNVAYRLSGKVALSEGLLRSVPFEERGSVKLTP